jgi:hypothetical protein
MNAPCVGTSLPFLFVDIIVEDVEIYFVLNVAFMKQGWIRIFNFIQWESQARYANLVLEIQQLL